ncbi:putative reverse transcriptase domain-containing protein [Tanacetum coccineum]
MKQELWTLNVKGDDIEGYNNWFHELALTCPDLVTPEKKKIKRYIRGLPERVKANVTSSKPARQEELVKAIKGNGRTTRGTTTTTVTAMSTLIINNKIGDKKLERFMLQPQLKTSRERLSSEDSGAYVNSLQNVTCYGCGEKGHFRNKRPKKTDHQNQGAQRRAYVIRTEDPQQNPNVVTGTFLLNDHYASILFDSGAEKSFVSTVFTPFIDIAPATLDTSYDVELANRKADKKKPEDVPIVRDFSEVFPNDLLGLPLVCEIEFRIDMIPGALPVVKSSYRLAPFEMLKLSNQLKEL